MATDRGRRERRERPPRPEAGANPAIRRADYRPPPFQIDSVELRLDLAVPVTTVTSRLRFRRTDSDGEDLVLDGRQLDLVEISLDGRELEAGEYRVEEHSLTVFSAANKGELRIVTRIRPAAGAMEGLVKLGDVFVTHCEPAGFRRITYFPDRPDVLARYRCTLTADRKFPVLLSNGHLVDSGPLPDNRHFATWEDPYPKASYLFATVAGDFDSVGDHFETRSGRTVTLTVFAKRSELAYCRHGLAILKKAMKWDEEIYGREYDLDVLNIAVMRSYPGGAMENKGLNLYTSEFFLASPETATDDELRRIEATIAHEYFHNWSGNRVGCRSWFDLSLKEGFTILRQQEFMATLAGADVARIDELIRLREQQYPEDDGGAAHPVRPDSYRSVNNLYTRTVYEKGAEIIRMLRTLLGDAAYFRAVDTFFRQYDGQATTIDAFLDTVERASGRDFSQFRCWYRTKGARTVAVDWHFDRSMRRCSLTFRQIPSDHDTEGMPLQMPVPIGLIGPDGQALPLRLVGEEDGDAKERVLELCKEQATFVFEGIGVRPVPSVFRRHSAPVRVAAAFRDDDLVRLALHDTDAVNRWAAARQLATRALLARVDGLRDTTTRSAWLALFGEIIEHSEGDAAVAARMLQLPAQREVGQSRARVDVDGIWLARCEVAVGTARAFRDQLATCHERLRGVAEQPEGYAARRLANVCLWYSTRTSEPGAIDACREQWRESRILENQVVALQLLVETGGRHRERALHEAWQRWRDVPSLVDRWFAVQAAAESRDCTEQVAALTAHPEYTLGNTTRLKALFDTFVCNQAAFHETGGKGYRLVADTALALNRTDPRLAARFLKGFSDWQRYDYARCEQIAAVLRQFRGTQDLALELRDIAERLLEADGRRE